MTGIPNGRLPRKNLSLPKDTNSSLTLSPVAIDRTAGGSFRYESFLAGKWRRERERGGEELSFFNSFFVLFVFVGVFSYVLIDDFVNSFVNVLYMFLMFFFLRMLS